MADGSVTIEFNGDTKELEKDINGIGNKVNSGFGKIKSMASTALKGVTVAVGAATTAIGGLLTASVKSYAEYEQLVGGVDTLFKNSSQKLQSYADEAYKTAGMSANEYMSTVTSFSASLLQSLGNDTEKAADYANQAVIDMSDNANKMGTSMELIQNAYQGFAKQNYTMLDNLKLGYGGTKEEMERLLEDASKISGIKYDISSFADVTQAIHVMQESMGIAGTTAKEASTTIEGSLNSVKGAWNNLLVGISASDTDWEKLINNLVDTVSTAMDNIIPVVKTALIGVSALIRDLFPKIAQEIPSLISEILPSLIDAGISIVNHLITGIQQNLSSLLESAIQIVESFANSLLDMLPQLIQIGMEVILQLIIGIAQMLPDLIPKAVDCILTIVEGLLDNIDLLVDAAIQLIFGLAEGLIKAIPVLIQKVPEIIEKLVNALIKNASKILAVGIILIAKLAEGIGNGFSKVLSKIGEVVSNIVKTLRDGLVGGIQNLGQTIWSILVNAWNTIVSFFTETIPQWIQNIITWFQQLPYNIGLLIGQIIGHIIQFGLNIWNWITVELPKIIQGITQWFAQLPGNIWTWLCNVITKIVEWGQNTWNTATTWVSNTINSIVNCFKELPRENMELVSKYYNKSKAMGN